MKEQYVISLDRLQGISIKEMSAYIRDAVESWANGGDPESPLFNFKENVRSVKRFQDHARPTTSQSRKIITVTIEGGIVQDVTGVPSGYELHVEDHDDGDTSHPSWNEGKQCFITIFDGEAP